MGVRMTDNCRFAPVSPTEKLVLLVLADCHNDETGRCFPGLAYLSRVTGLNRRTIQSAIQKLETAGVIRVRRGRGSVNSTYQLPSRSYPDQRAKHPGEPAAPVQEIHHGDASGPPQEVIVMHRGDDPRSPKPEWNQNKEPENNQNGFSSERSTIRSTPELSSSMSADGTSSPSRRSKLTRAQRRENKAPGKDVADPRFHDIITRWHEAYATHTGEAYIFHGGKDGASLKRFLQAAANVAPETFIERAKAAWARAKADRFATRCAQAATLHGFCTCWNDIGQQLKTPTPAEVASGNTLAGTPRRTTHHARDERGQRLGEIPTDVSADEIRRL